MKIYSSPKLKLILPILLLYIVYVPAIACGPMLAADEGRYVLFNPDVIQYPQLMAFQYSQNSLHGYDAEQLLIDRRLNVAEWHAYTRSKASRADIDAIQYSVAPDSFLAAYRSNDWKGFEKNTFIQWLRQRRNRKAMDYMAFAKTVEQNQDAQNGDIWQLRQGHHHTAQLDTLAQLAAAKIKPGKRDFLSQRYAFQMIKCSYYSNFYQEGSRDMSQAKKIFATQLENQQTIIAQWALIYRADMESDTLARTLFFLKAFDQTEEKKVRAFGFLSVPALRQAEQQSSDTGTKVLARAVAAMMNPGRGLQDLKYISALDPGNKYLPLLITREVNKLEDWIYSPELLHFMPQIAAEDMYEQLLKDTSNTYYSLANSNLASDKQYLKEVLEFLAICSGKKLSHPEVCQLATVHLYIMNGNFALADQALNHMQVPKDTAVMIQYLIEKLSALTNLKDLKQAVVKEELATYLRQLAALRYQLPSDENRWEVLAQNLPTTSDLYIYLSRKFAAAGDQLSAGLLHQSSLAITNEYGYQSGDSLGYEPLYYLDKYGSPADVDALIAYKHKSNKTAFEQVIMPKTLGTDYMYLDLKGTLLIRQMKYEEALAVFQQMPDSFWEKTYAYKDYLPLQSITDLGSLLPGQPASGHLYPYSSKKLIVQEIVDLKKKIALAKDRETKAINTFQLANALYNSSYYGRAWMLSAYGQSSTEPYLLKDYDNYHFAYYYVFPSATNNVQNYYGLQATIATYQEALALAAKDKETAAKCLLMLAYCHKIAHKYQLAVEQPNSRWKKDAGYNNPYMAQLGGYSNTKSFDHALTKCPDVAEYFSSKE